MSSKAIFLVDDIGRDFNSVYTDEIRRRIAGLLGLDCIPLYDEKGFRAEHDSLVDTEIIFSTWNMPVFSDEEVAGFLPRLRHLFYAAGATDYFASPYLARGVSVYSAARVNAIPVAEFAASQCLLASKGFYASRITPVNHFFRAKKAANAFPGNYRARIGILGLGNIGSLVAKRLNREPDLEILAYDPYVSRERCAELGAEKASLEEIFATCDVVTNHMPDIPETRGIIGRELLSSMKPTATLINSGRGAQVDERALASTLKKNPLQAAVLDVTYPEPIRPWNPLLRLKNAYITPHIAGSLGNEKVRLGKAMLDECSRVLTGDVPMYKLDSVLLKEEA